MKKKPDIVLSGINRGSNAGRNVLYSGTVGGAIEAAMRGFPSIAFSAHDYENPDFERAGRHVIGLVEYVLKHPLPSGTLLNVNFPTGKTKGLRMARQGRSGYIETPDRRHRPFGDKHYYWLGGAMTEHDEHEESDIQLLEDGYITAVPLFVDDLTHHDEFQGRRDHFRSFFKAASHSSKRSKPSA